MKHIGKWAGSGAALLVLGHVLPGFRVVDLTTALVVALLYGLVVAVVHAALIPLAYTVFVWVPRLLWELGCLLVVNLATVLVLAHALQGFQVTSIESAAIAVVVLSAVGAVMGKLLT